MKKPNSLTHLLGCPASLAAMVLVLLCPSAAASMGDGFTAIGEMQSEITKVVGNMVSDPGSAVRQAANVLFMAIATIYLVWKGVGWALRGLDVADIFFTGTQIAICALVMQALPVALPVIFNGALYIGSALMSGIMGVPLDKTADANISTVMVQMAQKWTFNADCGPWAALPGGCLVGNVSAVFATVLAYIVAAALGIAAMFVDVWGFWIFSVAMAIGVVLVPFMLYERLSFLFDGWCKFFFGALVYIIIARVNLALVGLAMMTYVSAGADAFTGSGLPGQTISVKSFADVIGMQLFFGVGIFTLFATGSFARSVVMGAGGGGVQFGAMAQAASNFVSGAATAVVTAGAAAGAAVMAAKDKANDGGNKGDMAKAGVVAAVGKVAESQKDNAAFKSGYAVGREAMAGAMHSGRGLTFAVTNPDKLNHDNVAAKAGGVVGSAFGGAAAAASTAAALALGLKPNDSFANARELSAAKDAGQAATQQAQQSLDRNSSNMAESERKAFSDKVQAFDKVVKSSSSQTEISKATDGMRQATQVFSQTAALNQSLSRAAENSERAQEALDKLDTRISAETKNDLQNKLDTNKVAAASAQAAAKASQAAQAAADKSKQTDKEGSQAAKESAAAAHKASSATHQAAAHLRTANEDLREALKTAKAEAAKSVGKPKLRDDAASDTNADTHSAESQPNSAQAPAGENPPQRKAA